jgi:hypothetical protein
MAEVIHRYVADPGVAAARKAERAAAEKRREAEAKRKDASKRAASSESAELRREQTIHERLKRLQRETEIAERRGQLIERDLVERQAGFLLAALRSRCMAATSAWSRSLVNISDPREMSERGGVWGQSYIIHLGRITLHPLDG